VQKPRQACNVSASPPSVAFFKGSYHSGDAVVALLRRKNYGHDAKQRHCGPTLRGAAGFTFGFNDYFGVYLLRGCAVVRSLLNDIGETRDHDARPRGKRK